MLQLNQGDRTAYVNSCGAIIKGVVTRVDKWMVGIGFTYYVRHDDGAVGQFESNAKYLFKDGDPIPEEILQEHLLT
jgi:hypothetical protein